MKNIHILPTYKPSRLIIYSTLLNEFRLLDEPIEDWEHKKHIYITNSEEIKEGDWVITPTNDIIQWAKVFQPIGKKIILTTDIQLIKDGVQAIDDEFLEWFVKNPSCEEIEVQKWSSLAECGYSYHIIILKEEPKQETLEEAAENYDKKYIEYVYDAFIDGAKWQQKQDKNKYSDLELFINEVKDKIDSFEYSVNQQSYLSEYITEWFEQFKKS